jgi:hypothetical protein
VRRQHINGRSSLSGESKRTERAPRHKRQPFLPRGGHLVKRRKSKKNKLLFLFQSCFEIWAASSYMGVLCPLPGKSIPKSSRNHVPARIVTPKEPLGCGIVRQLFLLAET